MSSYTYTNGNLVKLNSESLADLIIPGQDTLSLPCKKEPEILEGISDVAKIIGDLEGYRTPVGVLVVDKEGNIRIYSEVSAQKADHAEYFLQIEGKVYPKQPKRNVMLKLFQFLVQEKGIDIEKVARHFNMGQDRLLVYADGEVTERSRFIRLAQEKRKSNKKKEFKPGYYFCEGNELIACCARGKHRTYALYNQWSRQEWQPAMLKLKKVYSQHKIYFGRVE